MASIDPLPIPPTPARSTTAVLPLGDAPSFRINTANRSYKHQYANIYFLRLKALRAFVEEKARTRWMDVAGHPTLVPRVLEVVKSQLCYVIGTIYMDMPLKPNVMEDIARDRSIPPPPPRHKFHSPEDQVMLEDESGRIQLSGKRLEQARLVTGIVVGALGMETPGGEFEVVDLCFPDLAPQLSNGAVAAVQDEEMDVDGKRPDEWIAVVSGLEIGSLSPSDALIQLLVEYLTGEQGGPTEQLAASQISRLIMAGNSLAPVILTGKGEIIPNGEEKKARRYGYDATNFSPHPTITFSAHLLDIARVMPIHLLPGETDPSGTLLPQQPFPRAMFGQVASLPTFVCETNPTYLRLGAGLGDSGGGPEDVQLEVERSILAHSGQPLDDMFKYLPSPPNTPLAILENTLRWRHMAPTAPDTLWCHPYFTQDPFILTETPDIYIAGGQKKFATRLIVDQRDIHVGVGAKKCRIVMVPSFAKTGTLVLINMRNLDVKTVSFAVEGMTGGGEATWGPERPKTPSPTPTGPITNSLDVDTSQTSI